MGANFVGQLAIGLTLGLAALGSALGIGAAGRSAAGAWARDTKAGKQLDFRYVIFVGMPLTQIFYAFLLLLVGLRDAVYDTAIFQQYGGALLGIGLACGLGEMFSAGCRDSSVPPPAARCPNPKAPNPLVFLIIAMGICETVGLLSFVLLWLMLPSA